jgi:transcriptional/translational regulatory protein YebC/TACO1
MGNTGEVYEITCDPDAYEKLKDTLNEREIPTQVAEISMVPQSTIQISDQSTAKKIIALMDAFEDHDDVQNTSDQSTAKKIIALMDAFEDHDDVQNTYANFDIPEDIVARIS